MYDAWMIVGEMASNASGASLREKLLGNKPDGTGSGWLDTDTRIDFQPICTASADEAHFFSPRLLSDPRFSTHNRLRADIHRLLPVPIGLEAIGQLYFGWGKPLAPGIFPPGTIPDPTTIVRSAFFGASDLARTYIRSVVFDHRTLLGRDNLALLCCLMMDTRFQTRTHTLPVDGFSAAAPWAVPLLADSTFLNFCSVAFSSWDIKQCFMQHDPYETLGGARHTLHVSVADGGLAAHNEQRLPRRKSPE